MSSRRLLLVDYGCADVVCDRCLSGSVNFRYERVIMSVQEIAITNILDQGDRVWKKIRLKSRYRCCKGSLFEFLHFRPHFQGFNNGQEIVDEIHVEIWVVSILDLASVCNSLHKLVEITQINLEVLNICLAALDHRQACAIRFESYLKRILSLEIVF